MFVAVDEAVDEALALRREGRRCELVSIFAEQARLAQRVTQIVREADDDADWRAAGCSSSAQWLAQLSSSDHRTAVRITQTSTALRSLPALDHAMSTGALTLDQVAAAAEFATPESDAELARVAVGKPPSAIGLAARTLAPPVVADDEALYARRALSMTWTRGRRELCLSGRLPLEQGAIFEQAIWDIAKQQRAADKQTGSVPEWQQSAADALVTLAQQRRRRARWCEAQRDDADRAPERRRSRRSSRAPGRSAPRPPSGSPATRGASRSSCSGRDLVHSRVGRCASYAQLRALHKRSDHCQYPGCTATRELEAHHLVADEHGGKTELANLILLCHRHHKLLHDQHIHTSGTGDAPTFTDAAGRPITTNQPHAPPH